MKWESLRSTRTSGFTGLSLTLGGLVLTTAAWGAGPVFSGPSIAKVATPVQFVGHSFAPNSAMSIVIRAANGAVASNGAVSGADGRVHYTLVAAQTGPYTLTVTDPAGRTLATATVNVLP